RHGPGGARAAGDPLRGTGEPAHRGTRRRADAAVDRYLRTALLRPGHGRGDPLTVAPTEGSDARMEMSRGLRAPAQPGWAGSARLHSSMVRRSSWERMAAKVHSRARTPSRPVTGGWRPSATASTKAWMCASIRSDERRA